jgi:UDP-glucose 4-epimerase
MILVTGGAGYIGSHFVRTYLEANPNDSLLVVDNLSMGHAESLKDLPGVTLEKEDIGNLPAMQKLFSKYKVDKVVHFAASSYVGESQENPSKYFKNNTINSLLLFQAMEEAGVRKIIFSSTCTSYGNPKYVPMDEAHPQEPINVYGLTKLMTEKALAAYANTRGWSYIVLRYFNAAGAHESGLIGGSYDPETRLIPLALKATLDDPELQIYGSDYDTPDGTCIRDYIHVCDLADAHCAALKLLDTQTGGDAINLGTAQGSSVNEVIAVCEQVTGMKIPKRFAPRRPGDPPVLVAKAQKAAERLNWKPRYDLKRIVETAWNWERNRKF